MTAAPDPGAQRPPLGAWSRVYALVVVLALVVMALLWWFTGHYNIPLPRK